MGKIFISLICTACVLMITGCGGSSTARTSAPSKADHGNLLDQINASGELRIGVKVDSKPFGYKLGDDHVGFDIDIAAATAGRIGVQSVVFVPVTSANRMAMIESGEVDMVIASMTITRSRDEQVDFTVPYFQDGQGLLVPEGSPIQSYLDLDGAIVGVTKGSTSALNIGQVAPDATVVQFDDYAMLRAALLSGTVDAVTSDIIILLGMIGRDDLRLAGSAFTTEPYGIAVRENQSDFRDALSDALQQLWETGEYQLIYDTWFGPSTRYSGAVQFSMRTYAR